MNGNSDWIAKRKKQIDELKHSLSEKEYSKYKLRLLLCRQIQSEQLHLHGQIIF